MLPNSKKTTIKVANGCSTNVDRRFLCIYWGAESFLNILLCIHTVIPVNQLKEKKVAMSKVRQYLLRQMGKHCKGSRVGTVGISKQLFLAMAAVCSQSFLNHCDGVYSFKNCMNNIYCCSNGVLDNMKAAVII